MQARSSPSRPLLAVIDSPLEGLHEALRLRHLRSVAPRLRQQLLRHHKLDSRHGTPHLRSRRRRAPAAAAQQAAGAPWPRGAGSGRGGGGGRTFCQRCGFCHTSRAARAASFSVASALRSFMSTYLVRAPEERGGVRGSGCGGWAERRAQPREGRRRRWARRQRGARQSLCRS